MDQCWLKPLKPIEYLLFILGTTLLLSPCSKTKNIPLLSINNLTCLLRKSWQVIMRKKNIFLRALALAREISGLQLFEHFSEHGQEVPQLCSPLGSPSSFISALTPLGDVRD